MNRILQRKLSLNRIIFKNLQAPNRSNPWSVSQETKSIAMSGPRYFILLKSRFEQTDMSIQPNPPCAQELIGNVPITFVNSRVVACDGGELGHPKVFMNLDQGNPMSCGIFICFIFLGYCGKRFQRTHD